MITPPESRLPKTDMSASYEPELPIDSILAFGMNPRQEFEEEALAELSSSIAACGVLQPVLVRLGAWRRGRQYYDIVAGERRLRAAQNAGLKTIPAIVRREMLHTDAVFAALAENMHRQDLTALEIAQTYRTLMEMPEPLTQKKIAERMRCSEVAVSHLLRLLDLPPDVQALIKTRQLPYTSARALAYHALKNPKVDVSAAARKICEEHIPSKLLEKDFERAVFGAALEAAPEEDRTAEAAPGEEAVAPVPVLAAVETAPAPEAAKSSSAAPAGRSAAKTGTWTGRTETGRTETGRLAPEARETPCTAPSGIPDLVRELQASVARLPEYPSESQMTACMITLLQMGRQAGYALNAARPPNLLPPTA